MPRQDGASETWQKLLKLRTTASVMHITAHPDDEHGGVLAKLSRGDGARLALLTLNRGESGDNAIGPQLFDALGLIRTEELLDRRSPLRRRRAVLHHRRRLRLLEAARGGDLDKWGREKVLRDVVRIIRMNRPTIILSRFQGNERDGHGNHQTAGLMAVEGFRAAGDPNRYPEQIAEGLRPWQPKKVYIGGVRENEDWTVRIDSGVYDPRLGDSYDNVARYGLSFQRSQTSGRFTPTAGPNYGYYCRGRSASCKGRQRGERDDDLRRHADLDRSDGRRGGQADRRCGGEGDGGVHDDRSVGERAGAGRGPEADARGGGGDEGCSMRRFVLDDQGAQFQDAINSAMGMELTAVAQPAGVPEPTGPGAAFAPPALMAAPVPGQTFEVRARLANRGGSRRRRRSWHGDHASRAIAAGRSTPAGVTGGPDARAASAGDRARHGDARRRRGAQHASRTSRATGCRRAATR